MYQKLRIQPLEIEQMYYYELEYTLENLKNWLEKEQEQRKKEEEENQGKYSKDSIMKESQSMMKKYGIDPGSAKSGKMPSGTSVPKMPNIGSMKMPKI